MNEKIIFVRTDSGEDEVRSRTAHLSKDIKRALLMVDGTATVAEIVKRSSPSLRVMLEDMFNELERGGYIRDKSKLGGVLKRAMPPVKPVDEVEELDFTAAYRAPTPEAMAEEAARLKNIAAAKASDEVAAKARAVAEERAKLESEVARLKSQQQVDMARRTADQAANRAKAEAEASAREEIERRARAEAEAARIKAELHAEKVGAEAEARVRAVAEEKARLEVEVANLKSQAEAEARARSEASAQAKREAEAVRVKAEQVVAAAKAEAEARAAAEEKARREAEAARIKAEQKAAAAKAEAEAVAAREEQARREAEEKARREAEEKARCEVEAARIKAEQEAARARAEAEAKAEQRVREEAEAARIKAEQQASLLRAEAEANARVAAEERARLEAEVAKLKEQAETEARLRAEAAEQSRREAEAARVKAEQEADRARAEAEARTREQAEQRAREALEAARIEAEQKAAQIKAEAVARAEAAEQSRREAEAARVRAEQEAASVRAEAQARAREQAERRAREEAEAARIKAEQQSARAKAEADARVATKEKAALEAEVARLKAQAEAEARARAAAEEQARHEVDAARTKAEQEAVLAREEVAQVRQHFAAESRAREEAEQLAREAAAAEVLRAEALALAEAVARAEQAQAVKETRAQEESSRLARDVDGLLAAAQEAAGAQPVAGHQDDAIRLMGEEAHTNTEMLAALVLLNAKNEAKEESVFSALEQTALREADKAASDSGRWARLEESAPADPNVGDRRQIAAVLAGTDSRGGNNGIPVRERRTTTAAVVFFDIVGYTKRHDSKQIELKLQFSHLLSSSLESLDSGERIILDTGDGAAVGFLRYPTDALETAMHFRNALMANRHADYPDLLVRIGIHLGPVSLVKDMNGQVNMLGDGINSAQRVMDFSGQNQICVSRAYFDFVSGLSDQYSGLFRSRGALHDKHGREHYVYELRDAEAELGEPVQAPVEQAEPSANLAPFSLAAFDVALLSPGVQQNIPGHRPAETGYMEDNEQIDQIDIAGQLLNEAAMLNSTDAVPERPESYHLSARAEHAAIPEEAHQPVEQEQKFSEQEARQLADMQAAVWAEAEERALEAARKSAEQTVAQAGQPRVKTVPSVAAPVHRKPLPWGKLGAGVFVLVLLALFVVPYLLPTQGYRADMEQWLGKKLQQPVHIGHLSGRILPTPRLLLSEVYIGETKQIQSRQVQVDFSFSALSGATRSINRLVLDGVQVDGAALPQVASWLQQVAADRQFPVAHIVLSQGQLDADGLQFSELGGELSFDPSGKFTLGNLSANGSKIKLEMRAEGEQKLQLDISLRDSALPLFPNWVFSELKATGELSRDELRLTDLDGRILGGALTGEARINWRSGWRVLGAIEAKVIPLQGISQLMSGDMDGTAHFQMQAGKLSGLNNAAVFNGLFSVRKGIISGMDMVEAARLRSRENLPGGRTHFDELSGELNYGNGIYRFTQLKINDSVLRASGTLTVAKQQLSGSISADLVMLAGKGSTSLRVGGTSESPTLVAEH